MQPSLHHSLGPDPAAVVCLYLCLLCACLRLFSLWRFYPGLLFLWPPSLAARLCLYYVLACLCNLSWWGFCGLPCDRSWLPQSFALPLHAYASFLVRFPCTPFLIPSWSGATLFTLTTIYPLWLCSARHGTARPSYTCPASARLGPTPYNQGTGVRSARPGHT